MKDTIYSHCRYIKIEAVEVYYYSVEMDTNPSIMALSANGYVDIFIPVDRFHRYVRRLDAIHNRPAPAQETVNIGHLYISNPAFDLLQKESGQANIQKIDLDVPFPKQENQTSYNQFLYGSDSFETRFPTIAPWQWPFDIKVDVFDEFLIENTVLENTALESTVLRAFVLEQIEAVITQHSNFERQLVLKFNLKLAIPRTYYHRQTPVLKSVQLDWPVTTSYHSIELVKGSQAQALRYNASRNCIQWGNTGFTKVLPSELSETEQNLIVFKIDDLLLNLKEPGEFYNRIDPIPCRMEIEIPDCLLSGTQVDYFDATGEPGRNGVNGKISLKTIIQIDMKIDLDQRFNRRTLSPLYELFFEGLILRKGQIQAIENILEDLGFSREGKPSIETMKEVKDEKTTYGGYFKSKHSHNQMRLWVCAVGTKRITNRETVIPGGRKYHTPVESGSTEIALRAEMEGDVSYLTAIMNNIHRELENHFRYMTPPS